MRFYGSMAPQPIDRHLKKLAAFKQRYGHLALPQTTRELYNWAAKQRDSWRTGRLDRTLEKRLRAIGFPLEVEACEWESAFFRILSIGKQVGHLRLRSDWGRWLDGQRELHRRGLLPPDRAKRLRQIGALEQ